MAAGILGALLFSKEYVLPEVSLQNLNPAGQPAWPYMFVTVACGAISGFHATQSPMIAKCVRSEKDGRKIFYGAMITEAVIALIWAAAGVSFYESTGALSTALAEVGQSGVVYDISFTLLGTVGGILSVIGVIACPVTSGDTAFRGARLIIAECTKLDQKPLKNRLLITLPLLGVGAILTQLDFNVLWRYFSWSNQTLAMVALWVATSYLLKTKSNAFASLITALPAAFMSAVSMTYILMAEEGLKLSASVAYPVGTIFALSLFAVYAVFAVKRQKKELAPHETSRFLENLR